MSNAAAINAKQVYSADEIRAGISREEAEAFLSAFGPPSDHCFQCFPDGDDRPNASTGLWLGSSADHWDTLVSANCKGSGVFFTPNHCVGGRRAENVVEVRSVWVDLDGPPLEPVLKSKVPPHIIVESSPGKYHAYWLVAEVAKEQFKSIQQRLARMFGGDKSVCDLPRVMRLPGLFHLKGTPFLTRVVKRNDGPRLTPEALFAWLDEAAPNVVAMAGRKASPKQGKASSNGQGSLAHEVERVSCAPQGERNSTLFAASCRMGRMLGLGIYKEHEIREALTSAALVTALSVEEIEQTISSGLKRGMSDDAASDAVEITEQVNVHHAVIRAGGSCRVINLQDPEPTYSKKDDFLAWYDNQLTPIIKRGVPQSRGRVVESSEATYLRRSRLRTRCARSCR